VREKRPGSLLSLSLSLLFLSVEDSMHQQRRRGRYWRRRTKMRACVSLLLALATVALAATMVHGGFSGTFLPLERAIPLNQPVELEALRARDRERHGRILQGVFGGVVDFAVQGTSDPYVVGYG